MLYFGVPSTLLHPHSSYEFIELRKEMSASLRSDTGKKLKLLEFPSTFPGMMNLESKNLGILFWSWGMNPVQCWNPKLQVYSWTKMLLCLHLGCPLSHSSEQWAGWGPAAALVSGHYPVTTLKGPAMGVDCSDFLGNAAFWDSQRQAHCGQEDVSEADSRSRGLFLEYSEEADGVAAHTAPGLGAAGYSFQSCQSLKPHN